MKIAFYAQDLPFNDGVISHGLHRVNRHIIDSLEPHIITLINTTYKIKCKGVFSDIYNKIYEKTYLLLRPDTNIVDAIIVIAHKLGFISNLPKYKFKKLESLKKNSKFNCVFTTVGTDISAIFNAQLVAEKLECPLILYLVDEPISASILNKVPFNQKKHIKYIEALKKIPYIFCITDGLRKHLLNEYNIPSFSLNLPYQSDSFFQENLTKKKKELIVFIGSTSILYQEGIRDLLSALKYIKSDIKLVFTIKSNFVLEMIRKFGSENISIIPCSSDNELHELIHSSLASFLPYCFEKEFSTMIATSYPSKLNDYLYSSSNILVYAPEYSSFRKLLNNHFQYVQIRSIKSLADSIIKLKDNLNICNNNIYRDLLEEKFSYNTFKFELLNKIL